MILWFGIFDFGLWTSAYDFFLQLRSWPIWVKICDIPRAVKICKLIQWRHNCVQNFLAIIASERNKRRSGMFFVTGGPVLVSCKTPLTRKELSCLYFRKMKLEGHIVSEMICYNNLTTLASKSTKCSFKILTCINFVGIHRPTAKRRKRPFMLPPFGTKLLSTAF